MPFKFNLPLNLASIAAIVSFASLSQAQGLGAGAHLNINNLNKKVDWAKKTATPAPETATLDITYEVRERLLLRQKGQRKAIHFHIASDQPLTEALMLETDCNAPNLNISIFSDTNGKLLPSGGTGGSGNLQCYVVTNGRRINVTKDKQPLISQVNLGQQDHTVEVGIQSPNILALPHGTYEGSITLELSTNT